MLISPNGGSGGDGVADRTGGSGPSASNAAPRLAPAPTPGPEFEEAVIGVGDQRLRVQVADTDEERARGLMYRDTIDPYDGMLFVFESDIAAAFTMSNTRVALSIGFYKADGTRVGNVVMKPCPDVPERCPVYRSPSPYRYALETAQGQLPEGRLMLDTTSSTRSGVGRGISVIPPR